MTITSQCPGLLRPVPLSLTDHSIQPGPSTHVYSRATHSRLLTGHTPTSTQHPPRGHGPTSSTASTPSPRTHVYDSIHPGATQPRLPRATHPRLHSIHPRPHTHVYTASTPGVTHPRLHGILPRGHTPTSTQHPPRGHTPTSTQHPPQGSHTHVYTESTPVPPTHL